MAHQTFHYAGTAMQAPQHLDETHAARLAGAKGLDEAALARPRGPAEGFFTDYPMAALVLYINRKALRRGAEIALLRDLYANR